jgi:predicted kinase
MKNQENILHLICGIPGTGKTTLAKKIANETSAIRFCPDEWIKSIWHDKSETEGNAYRDLIEQLQWKISRDILSNGGSVIIEWGTWGQSEREILRDDAHKLGAKVKFYYLTGSKEELKKRILVRNHDEQNQFLISEAEIDDLLELAIKSIQIPTPEELKTYDFLGEISDL